MGDTGNRFKAELNRYRELSKGPPSPPLEPEHSWYKKYKASTVNKIPAAKPPIPKRKTPEKQTLDTPTDELQKWKEFSKLMTEAYEDMKQKYEASAEVITQDVKVITALQEQVKKLKLLLAKTHREKEDLTLTKRKHEEQERGSSRAESNVECSQLADQIINLRTSLDKAHTDIVKLRRSESTSSRLNLQSSPTGSIDSRYSGRRRN